MKKNFLAQSTLELIMVIILVLAGIFVMGPYVIRGVNAHMHSWEISVDQANSNPNVTIENVVLPPPPANCQLYLTSAECDSHSSECMWVLEYACPYCGQPGEYCDLDHEYCMDKDYSWCNSFDFSSNECCIQDGPCFNYGNPCNI